MFFICYRKRFQTMTRRKSRASSHEPKCPCTSTKPPSNIIHVTGTDTKFGDRAAHSLRPKISQKKAPKLDQRRVSPPPPKCEDLQAHIWDFSGSGCNTTQNQANKFFTFSDVSKSEIITSSKQKAPEREKLNSSGRTSLTIIPENP